VGCLLVSCWRHVRAGWVSHARLGIWLPRHLYGCHWHPLLLSSLQLSQKLKQLALVAWVTYRRSLNLTGSAELSVAAAVVHGWLCWSRLHSILLGMRVILPTIKLLLVLVHMRLSVFQASHVLAVKGLSGHV
jgi:hypothetical protein